MGCGPVVTTRDTRSGVRSARRGLTLVEMLVGMAITLVMMAAVVTLFANVSGSVRNRRASAELSGQLRLARARLSRDLAGATCVPTPSQDPNQATRPAEAVGYLEIIEGRFNDAHPSLLTDHIDDPRNGNPELNYADSIVPGSQLVDQLAAANLQLRSTTGDFVTDGRALGDHDDILALTVRSDGEPFVGRDPANNLVESDFAEVIWYSVENPADGELGEPGMRTVYRRVLLIAPWVSLPGGMDPDPTMYFQESDISARWDPQVNDWVANTLADLTKRENRCYRMGNSMFPHGFASLGRDYTSTPNVQITRNTINNPNPLNVNAAIVAQVDNNTPGVPILSYRVDRGGEYAAMPSLQLTGGGGFGASAFPVMKRIQATPPVWEIAAVTSGPPPLAFDRHGEDLMLNDVLAWDVRVFDPGAPLLDHAGTVVGPSDAGWYTAPGGNNIRPVGYGEYVDLHWNPPPRQRQLSLPLRGWYNVGNVPAPLFEGPPHPKSLLLFPHEAVYDTWSFHYENDGRDQDDESGNDNIPDGDPNTGAIDEGTNGLDDDNQNGVDDVGELETSAPYPVPLRGLKVILRAYERDAQQIRETSVTHSFVP